MKRSRLRPDRDGRGPWTRRPAVESLEGRAMLSAAPTHAAAGLSTKHLPAPPPAFNNPIYAISASIPAVSDPGGSGNIFQQNVFVGGYAAPYSAVWLAIGPHGYYTNVALADFTGHYAFEVAVPPGKTPLRLFAENGLHQYSVVTTLDVTRGDPIVAWDSIAIRAIRNLNLTGPEAARDLAILHLAQYDAVMAVQSPGKAYLVHVAAPKGASAEAAADAAARTVLDALFPSQAGAFTLAMNGVVAGLGNSRAITDGFALGDQVARATLAARANDGSNLAGTIAPSGIPGLWRPTPPSFAPATDPTFGQVTPFALTGGSQFRPPAPPAVGSAAYDEALAEVASLGRLTSTTRTASQSAAAQFWSDGANSFTNPGHWNEIAEGLALARKGTLAADARLFARLDVAMADAGIAASDAKAAFHTWRPISAIQRTDPSWVPLVPTPDSPSYVSDHAAFGAAAADVLAADFGANVRFTDALYAATGVTRTFPSFAAAAAEAAQSQVWAGDSFAFDVQQGQALGDNVGRYVLARFPKGK